MSETNKAIARRLLEEIWNQGNLAVIDELVADDYQSHDPVNPGVRGRDGYRGVVQKYRTAFPDTRFKIEDLLADGDRVIMRWVASGTQQGELEGMAPTNKHVSVTGITISQVAGGKVRAEWPVWDALGMMAQLGIVSLPGKSKGAGH